ncbi:cytochrome c [Luteibacter sp.]|jgi:mono/diheme cytochrome c family protein|uniref:c-type cytochrome n=1 Tax=Luteibacter sp. TaxID=1886636 RepID=UPI002F40341E
MRRVAILLIALLPVTGCERGMHQMYDQPRYERGGEAPLFADGVASRIPPRGTVPTSDPEAMPAPPAVTEGLLERGRDRYTIYCTPCHGVGGDGDGMVVRRGFPGPPSYHEQRLRDADDRHLYDVITRGWGVMYPYADRIAPADRQAIVAYIRALQFSRHAPVDRLEPEDLSRLRDLPSEGARQ